MGKGSAAWPEATEDRAGNLGTGTSVSRVGVELLDAALDAVLSGAECSHLSGEISDLLPKFCVLRWLINASGRRLDFDLEDAIRTEGCGLQVALVLAGEEALNVAG